MCHLTNIHLQEKRLKNRYERYQKCWQCVLAAVGCTWLDLQRRDDLTKKVCIFISRIERNSLENQECATLEEAVIFRPIWEKVKLKRILSKRHKFKLSFCLSVEEWIRKMWYIYTTEYHSAIKKKKKKKNAICSNWMDLEIAILKYVSQTEKNKYHMISFICGI